MSEKYKVPLKEWMAASILVNWLFYLWKNAWLHGYNFFFYKHTAAERISQTMDDFNISCEIKTVSF